MICVIGPARTGAHRTDHTRSPSRGMLVAACGASKAFNSEGRARNNVGQPVKIDGVREVAGAVVVRVAEVSGIGDLNRRKASRPKWDMVAESEVARERDQGEDRAEHWKIGRRA